MHWYQSYSSTIKQYIINCDFLSITQYVFSASQKTLASQKNLYTQNGNSHKCLPVIDRADKAIYGSSEALANRM